jgi:hypothetical protein
VVDALFRKEPYLIERLRNVLLLTPVNVPVVLFRLVVLTTGERLLDAVGEESLELDLGTN